MEAQTTTAAPLKGSAEANALRANNETILQVTNLKKYFPISQGIIFQRKVADVKAVDGITFNVKQGETLGLVGESGCGNPPLGAPFCNCIVPPRARLSFREKIWLTSRAKNYAKCVPICK